MTFFMQDLLREYVLLSVQSALELARLQIIFMFFIHLSVRANFITYWVEFWNSKIDAENWIIALTSVFFWK